MKFWNKMWMITQRCSKRRGADYDTLGRPVTRNADAFAYNDRSEVVFSRGGAANAEDSYAYDGIGNLLDHAGNGFTNTYTANSLNQYTSVSNLCVSVPLCEPSYDTDGNLLTNGVFSYTYDASSRLASVSSNGVLLASFAYDAQGRRVRKVSHRGTETRSHTYFYDGWTPVRETATDLSTLQPFNSSTGYVWGKDLSGSIGGAGGVGGLLYVSISNSSTHQLYIPLYDANGNITHYCDASGNVVASYTYDAFGNTIAQSGAMADTFPHRFSTKYFDTETSLYYYGYRFYSPELMRWLNRDPIEEQGGMNLYAMCRNHPTFAFDTDGQYEWTEESATAVLRDAVREFRQYGWDFAADALAHFVDGAEINVDLSQYSGDISGNPGWRQRFLDNVSSKLSIGEENKKIGDIEHEANFHRDLSNEDFNRQTLFNQQFAYRFKRYDSGNLFYALYGSRYSYAGNASKAKEKINGNCCTKLDINLSVSTWDALTYPAGVGRKYFEQYSAAMYLESLRKPADNQKRFVPYIYLLWDENGSWVKCTEKYRGGTRTKSWKRR